MAADPGWGSKAPVRVAAPAPVPVRVAAPVPVAVPAPVPVPAPKPVWSAPKPVWTPPQPSWSPPQPTWSPPKPAWSAPKPNVPQQALVKIKSVIHTQAQALDEAGALQAAIDNAVNVRQTYAKKVSWAASKVQSLQESQLAHQQQSLDQARAVLQALSASPSWPAKGGHSWAA